MAQGDLNTGAQNTLPEVTREVQEFVELDIALDPAHLSNVWSELKHDPRFVELRHAVLNHAIRKYEGNLPEDISNYEAFIKGASFVIAILLGAVESHRSDKVMFEELEGKNPPRQQAA